MFWRGSGYACVQIAPGNMLRHHSKHLMEYFEFLNSSRIICLPLNISEKLRSRHVFEKLEQASSSSPSPSSFLIRYNTHAPWRITSTRKQTRGNHHHFFIRLQILAHVLVHSVDKNHVLVVTVKLIWSMFSNIFSSSFCSNTEKIS